VLWRGLVQSPETVGAAPDGVGVQV